jgi:hypothetical protein
MTLNSILRVNADWIVGGSHPQEYDLGAEFDRFCNVASIRSVAASTHGYGTLVQTVAAVADDQWKGRQIRLAAFLKAEKLTGWAGLWARLSGIENSSTRFDNMQKRDEREDGWRRCECIIDLPDSPCEFSFGAMLHGSGQVWISEVSLEVSEDLSW